MLNIQKTIDGICATLILEGRLDSVTSEELENELVETLDDMTELVLDLEKVEYISSAGLRVLLSAQKIMNKKGSMKVINVCDTVMEIFEENESESMDEEEIEARMPEGAEACFVRVDQNLIWWVRGDETGAVETECDRQVLEADIMDDLVVSPLHEGGVDGHHGAVAA